MACAAVDQVYARCEKRYMDGGFGPTITVDACENDITETPSTDSFSGIFWLVRI